MRITHLEFLLAKHIASAAVIRFILSFGVTEKALSGVLIAQ